MTGIIGNGSWATALAKMLTDNGVPVQWWMRSAESAAHLRQFAHNKDYLSSVVFNPALIQPMNDLRALIHNCDMLLVVVPSAYLQVLLEQLPADSFKGKKIISAVKGILPQRNQLLNDFLADQFDFPQHNYVAITGPCHAEEVSQERLSYLTFSGLDQELTAQVSEMFRTSYIKTGNNHDLWGAQYAAVLKNIYAIGAGMAHGMGYGDNFLSVYITNCYRELYTFSLQQFCKLHPGTEQPDFHTSTYLGDLLVTCYSLHSRNRAFGTLLGKGYTIQAATTEMRMVAEGYFAVRGMQKIAEDLQINMPLVQEIKAALWDNKPLKACFEVIENLLS